MKKFIIFVLCILVVVLNSSLIINANNSSKSLITGETNFVYEDQKIAIFGNLTDMNEDNSSLIKNHIRNSQHVLLYDLSEEIVSYKPDEINEDVLATAYSKQNGVLYRRTYSTNETDYKKILKGIDQFFSEFIEDVSQETSEMQMKKSHMISSVEPASMNTDFVKVEECSGVKETIPQGKIVFVTNVYVSQPDVEYSIYIVETNTEFVPGYTLRKLGDNTYKNYISSDSRLITSISETVRTYYGYVIYGETPNVLEYWPKNQVVNRTISTSFGIGAQIGYSSKDGLTGTITGNFGYSQSYETTDPSMTATTIEIGSKYGWNFHYHLDAARRPTHHFASGQLVEMLNGGNFNGQFSVQHDFWYRVDMFLGVTTYITYTPSFTVYAFDGQL
mgnify:CR=1 FL=1